MFFRSLSEPDADVLKEEYFYMIPENHYISQHVSGNQEVETAIISDRFSQTCPRTRLRQSAGCPGQSRAISIPCALSILRTTVIRLFPQPDVFPFQQYLMQLAEFLFFITNITLQRLTPASLAIPRWETRSRSGFSISASFIFCFSSWVTSVP